MRIVLLSLCVIGLTGLAENPRVDLAPSAEGRCRRLFNGKDLSGWYTFLKGRGKNVDPKGVFSVRDGVIHVTGEEWGCLTSEEEFSNYRLSLEYRFTGARQFGGKAEKAPDSGLLFHSTGPDGGFCGIWMESLELNIIKGATGDFWGVGMKGSDRIALSATVGKDLVEGKYAVHDPQGTATYTINGNTRVCRSDIARDWGDRKTVAVAANENPLGEWNRVVLTCVGDTVVAEVNGKVVNRGFAAKPQKGRIQLQSEGCEVEFRNIALRSLEPKPKAPGNPGEEHVGFTVVTTRTRGKSERMRLTVPVKDGVALFRWPRAAIPSDATCVEVIPDFATATKGEEGYFVMPDGGGCYGTFRAESGRLALSKNWFPITAFGMKTPRRTFVAMPTGMRWNFNPVVDVKGGVYTMSCRFDMDVATAYEDPAITFRFLTGEDANYSGMGRAVRAKRLADGEMKPLKERAKTNPTLAWAVGTPIVRIRHCWKDFRKVALPEQNLVDEPPVDVYCTFDRAKELARALRAAGVAKADLCLVGWNYRGHDGRYPQVFPVEPLLGGEAKLRELIRCVREELGWQIVGHMNYRDAYLISDLFDFEYCQDRLPDGTRDARHLEPWSGGAVYRICPQRAYERFALRHTAMMKSLGFSGLGYLDVTTSRPLFPCRDARHPLNNAERRVWENAIFDLQTRAFGGCSSEGGYDFALGHYDSALTISFAPAFNEPKKPGGKLPWHPLVDGRVPFWQIAYHGVVMSAPFRTVWNAVKNPDRRQLLKSIEYGGRPVFYVYGGWNLPDRAHWDIRCRTDAELADCVQTIKAGTDEYNRRAALEWEYMDDHRELQPGVFRVTYSNGARIYVNYNATPVAVDGLTLPALDALIR